ncbi:hypothetical protein HY68_09940 [Streptomyces sp. AcH 505]|uniref:DUF2797 domain-containing protein n=1 Tax=Streptomyces sp. AcH 505 TaxID=352211 RepID=UPI000591C454|nr:hypothetical protein HY68_09940 [Streptomyces sp. AcH 505]
MSGAWRAAGLRWPGGAPALQWLSGDGSRVRTRASELVYGRELAFRAVGGRYCPGARGNVCPLGAVVAGRSTGGQCPECARLDRAHSVAADTFDDPRPYRVYLAWFGPGLVKVGITAEARGSARLLEQGAVTFSWLGRGPLMAARRTEEVLRTALGVPDRIPYERKRAVRTALPPRGERAAEVGALHVRAVALEAWPQTLERAGFGAVDHADAFGLDGLGPATGVVGELVDGGHVAGRLVAAAGPDLHLATADGGLVVLDTRLMSGWELVSSDPGGALTVPVRELRADVVPTGQDGLF